MYQNFHRATSPTSPQSSQHSSQHSRNFTSEFEPYRLSVSNLTLDQLLVTLSLCSTESVTFAERTLLPFLLHGELPDRKLVEENLSQSLIDSARIERGYRFISGYCVTQKDEITLYSEWPITIERAPHKRGVYSLSIDLPTSERSTGTGWCFADELASKLELVTLSHFCRNGWAQLLSHPNEHRVSINLTQNIQLHLFPSELHQTLSHYIVHFPHHTPKEVLFLSHEQRGENQFARTVDETIGSALISSGILTLGREGVTDSYELNDDVLQECARRLHRASTPQSTFEYSTRYIGRGNLKNRFDTGTPDDSNLYVPFDEGPTPPITPSFTTSFAPAFPPSFTHTSLHHRSSPSDNTTRTTVRCEGIHLNWSNKIEADALECLINQDSNGALTRTLAASTIDLSNFNFQNKTEETTRLYHHAWNEALRIAKRYGAARNRDELELTVLQHRSNAGYPSILSPSFFMQLSDELLLHLTTSV